MNLLFDLVTQEQINSDLYEKSDNDFRNRNPEY